jgi:hypothetical protein
MADVQANPDENTIAEEKKIIIQFNMAVRPSHNMYRYCQYLQVGTSHYTVKPALATTSIKQ